VRAAAVQHVLSRNWPAQDAHSQSREGRAIIVPPQHKPPQHAQQVEVGSALLHRTKAIRETGSRSTTSPTLLALLQWAWRAGWRGLLLVGQLLALAVVVSVKQAVAAVLTACKSRQ
jgi:hypothetical protein